MSRLYVKIKDQDNVAIAVEDIPEGTEVMEGIITRHVIPQAHKVALCDIPKGGEIIRYGVVFVRDACNGGDDRHCRAFRDVIQKTVTLAGARDRWRCCRRYGGLA